MKVICIGRNYSDHAKELNNPVPSKPMIFMKPPSALLVNNKPFYYPEFTNDLHYELELVVKICKNGRHIQPSYAHKYYEQVALGIDFTARDLQTECKQKGHPWEIAKGFDGAAPISDFVSLYNLNRTAIEFELHKNGTIVQKGNTKDMIFSIDQIIVYVSKFFKLQMGDIIYTGTPAGVGPVVIGDKLEGFLHTKDEILPMLSVEIK
ncbi:MAG: fumarylacetoacetate hydrolase family protein [Saprospiraceae bacterium]|jgi:2-keto-4-pentenoate hydratase/2-oxohepta-3-ene-1,7-dioic acid hydratase in catechol pathway|nr:fumarylacetoacetate hydrolase family protein [Saprospiraceae bacterium]